MKFLIVVGFILFVQVNSKVILDENLVSETDETVSNDNPLLSETLEDGDVQISDGEKSVDLIRVPRQYPSYHEYPYPMIVEMPQSARTTLALKGAYLGEKIPEFLGGFFPSLLNQLHKPLPPHGSYSPTPLFSHGYQHPLFHHFNTLANPLPLPSFSPQFLQQLLLSSQGSSPVGRSNEITLPNLNGDSLPYSYFPDTYMMDLYNPYIIYLDPSQAMRSVETSAYMNHPSYINKGHAGHPFKASPTGEYQQIKRELEANNLPNTLSETT